MHPRVALALGLVISVAACTPSPGAEPVDAAPSVDVDAPVAPVADAMPDGFVGLDAAPDAPPGTGDPIAELANIAPKCSGAWCAWDPQPAGIGYQRIFHTGPDNIWMVGGFTGNSIVLQWNGTTWVVHRPQPSPGVEHDADSFIAAIGGSSPTNMWLLYGGTVQQWNGQQWTIMDTFGQSMSNSYNNVWVDATGVPWVTTSRGKVRRYVNGGWVEMSVGCNCFLGTIYGTDASDVFIATIGAIIHFDGQSFEFVYSGPTLGSFQGVKDDLWASGDGAMAHWDGASFTTVPTDFPAAGAYITRVAWLGPADAWWVAGGLFVHWDGAQITSTQLSLAASFEDDCCPGISAGAIIDGRWWLVGDHGGIYTRVSPTAVHPLVKVRFLGGSMWGTSMNDLYFGDPSQIRHWDGSTWTTLAIGGSALQGVPGGGIGGALEMFALDNDRDEATMEGVSLLVHFDGVSWTETELSRSPSNSWTNAYVGLFAVGPGEAVLIGYGGRALYVHDGVLEPIATGTTSDLRDVWGPSPDLLYIVGTNATVLEWRRTNPTVMTRDTTFPAPTITDPFFDLIAIDGADGVAWITQQNSHKAWRKPAVGPWQELDFSSVHVVGHALVAKSADDVIIFGNDSGSAARWNGTEFVYEHIMMNGSIQSGYVLPDGTMLARGSEGILVHPP